MAKTNTKISTKALKSTMWRHACTLEWTNKLIIPEYDKISDLEKVIMYLRKHNHSIRISSEDEWKTHNEDPNYFSDEDMLYIISGYSGDFKENIMTREEFDQRQKLMKSLGFRIPTTDTFENYSAQNMQYAEKQNNKYHVLLSQNDYKSACYEECKRRKEDNLHTLEQYGFFSKSDGK